MAGKHLTDDTPELGEAFFKRARPAREMMSEAAQSNFVRKPGRPKSEAPKQQITLRLSQSVLEKFKADGPGWQSRMDAVLQSGSVTPLQARLLDLFREQANDMADQMELMLASAVHMRSNGDYITADAIEATARRLQSLLELVDEIAPTAA